MAYAVIVQNKINMIKPRALINALHNNWDIIEKLIYHIEQYPTWKINGLLDIMRHTYIEETIEQHQTRLQQLINNEILLELPPSNDFEINPIVRTFASQLLNEHNLGLSSVIKARTEQINLALKDLEDAIKNNDMNALKRGINTIDKQLRDIEQQLKNDTHAIFDIAERAKTTNEQIPLTRRYQEVLETYERYIIPMQDLMDTGAGGVFYPLLEQTEKLINKLRLQLATQGSLMSHQHSLKLLNYRVANVRSLGREKLIECNTILLPLREEIRKHDQLSSAISKLLGDIRKRGLKHSFDKQKLPLWYKESSYRIIINDNIKDFWADAKNYTQKINTFPEIEDNEIIAQEWLDERLVEQKLRQELPINDLMAWLLKHYHEYQDVTLLKLYHRLLRLPDIEIHYPEQKTNYTLKNYSISLYSHRLSQYEPES
ncbi:hypothetical protein DOJK_01370 [Patescibacteria group bacterium]|nr:hypothetical protein DOJK_01370 [Patescibacteria group bacterium]